MAGSGACGLWQGTKLGAQPERHSLPKERGTCASTQEDDNISKTWKTNEVHNFRLLDAQQPDLMTADSWKPCHIDDAAAVSASR